MQPKHKLFLYFLAFCLALAPVLATFAQGTVLADTGFRPQQHGFSFANYGNETKPVNLTPAAMRELFGDRACKTVQNGECALTATAQAWMTKINNDMNGGHCEGMAALSKLIFTGQVSLASLDPNAKSIADLKADNPRVQAEIAKWFATQYVPPTATSEIRDQAPSQIVDTLINSLKPGAAPFTMGIYQAGGQGGHAIKPYSVVDMGNGVVRIMVYDNNYPNEERFIEVNRTANTWKYTGTTNPNEPVSEYSGNASSFSLTLTPGAARAKLPQECSFCNLTPEQVAAGQQGQIITETQRAGGEGQGECQTIVTTGSDTDVVVTTADGKKAGVIKGQAFSQIDGAVILRPRSQGGLAGDTPAPIILLPRQTQNVGISIQNNNANQEGEVFVGDCEQYQKVTGVMGKDGKPKNVLFNPNDNSLSLEADDDTFTLEGGFNSLDDNDLVYRLENVTSNGGKLKVGIDPETGMISFGSDSDVGFDPFIFGTSFEGALFEKILSSYNNAGGQGFSFGGNNALFDDDFDFGVFELGGDFFDDFDFDFDNFDALFGELDLDGDGELDEANGLDDGHFDDEEEGGDEDDDEDDDEDGDEDGDE